MRIVDMALILGKYVVEDTLYHTVKDIVMYLISIPDTKWTDWGCHSSTICSCSYTANVVGLTMTNVGCRMGL